MNEGDALIVVRNIQRSIDDSEMYAHGSLERDTFAIGIRVSGKLVAYFRIYDNDSTEDLKHEVNEKCSRYL